MKKLPKKPRTFGRKKAKPYQQNKQYLQISYPIITNVILDTSVVIDYVRMPDLTTTSVEFDCLLEEDITPQPHLGTVFKACNNNTFALTITSNNAKIIDKANVVYLNKPIELLPNETYRVACGSRIDYILWAYVLYVRIWQEEEQAA
jgi:hypothetical protein